MPLHATETAPVIHTSNCCTHDHQAPEPNQTEENHCGLCDLTLVPIDIPQTLVFPQITVLFSHQPVYIQQLADQLVDARHQARAPPYMMV